MRSVLDRVLVRSPAHATMRRRSRRHLAVLAYHAVDDADRFDEQLDWLAREMNPVSLDDVLLASSGGPRLPEDAVLVTFDDGHRSVAEVGLPLLRRRGFPSVVYVVAGLLDTDQPFWWVEVEALSVAGGSVGWWRGRAGRDLVRALKRQPDEVRLAAIEELRSTAPVSPPTTAHLRRDELAVLEDAGAVVGNHSLTHACLPRCSTEKIRHEVEEAQRLLTSALGHPPRSFAYPDGQWDARVAHAVRDVGCELAFLFDHRLASLPPADPFAVSRLRVNTTNSADRFEIIVGGLHSALHHRVGRR